MINPSVSSPSSGASQLSGQETPGVTAKQEQSTEEQSFEQTLHSEQEQQTEEGTEAQAGSQVVTHTPRPNEIAQPTVEIDLGPYQSEQTKNDIRIGQEIVDIVEASRNVSDEITRPRTVHAEQVQANIEAHINYDQENPVEFKKDPEIHVPINPGTPAEAMKPIVGLQSESGEIPSAPEYPVSRAFSMKNLNETEDATIGVSGSALAVQQALRSSVGSGLESENVEEADPTRTALGFTSTLKQETEVTLEPTSGKDTLRSTAYSDRTPIDPMLTRTGVSLSSQIAESQSVFEREGHGVEDSPFDRSASLKNAADISTSRLSDIAKTSITDQGYPFEASKIAVAEPETKDIDKAQLLKAMMSESKLPETPEQTVKKSAQEALNAMNDSKAVKPLEYQPYDPRIFVKSQEIQDTTSAMENTEVTMRDSFVARGASQNAEATPTVAPDRLNEPHNMQKILEQVSVLKNRGDQELVVQLDPEHLGKLTMRMANQGNGLNVEVLVDTVQAKQLIESNLQLLRNQFYEENLSLSQLSVSVSSEQSGSFLDNFHQGEQQPSDPGEDYIGRHQQDRLDVGIEDPAPQDRGSDSGVSLYA